MRPSADAYPFAAGSIEEKLTVVNPDTIGHEQLVV